MRIAQIEQSETSSADDQALQWFALLQSGDATGADRRRFRSWLGADALHRHEFEKLSILWADLDGAKPLLHDELTHAALDWEAAAHRQRHRIVRGWSPGLVLVVLALCLLLSITGGWWLLSPEVMEYRTVKDEQQRVMLSDGSTMTLNTATALTAEISMFRRTVVLREGEAYFPVSHEQNGDRQRLGKESPREQWQRLTAGEQVSYEPQRVPSSIETVSLATSTAWMEGKVIFVERPLAEVVQEIRRYQPEEIRILDPRVEALKVSGVFGVNDREGFLKALEHAVPVKSSHVNRELIVLEQTNDVSEKR